MGLPNLTPRALAAAIPSAWRCRLVRCHGDQKYELVSMPDDRHGVIRHKPCGQERTMLLDNFLWKSVRCPVCVSLSCEHWQNEIDPEIKKFQITDYRMNGKNQVLTVKHVGRGHSFEVKPALLQKYPFCRICESYHTGDSFMNLVNQEPGFELVGPYSEKGVDVLHERCGTISRVRPEHWRKGQRCLLCGNQRKGKYYLRSDVYLVLRELGTASAEDIYQNERIKTYRKGAGWIRKLLQALERDQYVECEDGLYHVAEPIVHNLRITRPEEHTTRTCKDRTGAVSVARNGQTMTVIAYRSCKDCDIQFEDGTIVKGVEYRYFKAGEIGNPNYRYRKWNKKKKEDE